MKIQLEPLLNSPTNQLPKKKFEIFLDNSVRDEEGKTEASNRF